jgi:AmiR/NasT family two-component response regulator
MTTSGNTDAGIGGGELVFAAVAAAGNGEKRAFGEGSGEAAARGEVVVIGGSESELLARATERGLERLLASDERLDDAIDLALKQVAELARLRTVTARLAQVERAKGILMERHKVTERDAHERMRRHARNLNVKLIVVAAAIEDSHLLIPIEEP